MDFNGISSSHIRAATLVMFGYRRVAGSVLAIATTTTVVPTKKILSELQTAKIGTKIMLLVSGSDCLGWAVGDSQLRES